MGLSCARAAGPATNAQKQHSPIAAADAPAHLFHIRIVLPLSCLAGTRQLRTPSLVLTAPDIGPGFTVGPPSSAACYTRERPAATTSRSHTAACEAVLRES